jgi:hypothetical protein
MLLELRQIEICLTNILWDLNKCCLVVSFICMLTYNLIRGLEPFLSVYNSTN